MLWVVLAIVWGQEPQSRQNDFWTLQKPDIRSRPKNNSRAMFLTLLAIVLGQEPEMVENGFLEVSKIKYSVSTQK